MYIIHFIWKHIHNIYGESTLSRLLRLGVSRTVGGGAGGETLSRPLRLGVAKTAETPPLITPNSWRRVGRSHVSLSRKPYPSAIEKKGMSTCVCVCVFVCRKLGSKISNFRYDNI